jgi:hypothetical protein
MTPQQQIILQCLDANVASAISREGKQAALDVRDEYKNMLAPARPSPFSRFLATLERS